MTEKIEITILVDNKAGPGLYREHGLSLWIETGGHAILFDTGQGPALPLNAKKLGVRLESADTLVLSHGHFDHTGGLPHVLRCNPGIHVYCHPAAVQPRYSILQGMARPIHMPHAAMAAIDKIPSPQLHWLTRPAAISDNIGLTGPIPRFNGLESAGGRFFLDPRGSRPDSIQDDLALWIKTPEGLVICLGCCHAGLINTIDHIRSLTGIENIAALVGGFHLMDTGQQEITSIISALQQMQPLKIVPCHCTGEPATDALLDAFPNRVQPGFAGMRLSL